MPTVLVTGGAGRIGTYLARGLPALGWTMRSLDVAPTSLTDGVESITADVTDPDAVHTAMADVDAVVHLAGIMRSDANFEEIEAANLRGTFTVLDEARQAGVRRFVFASSNHANGFAARSAGYPTADGDHPDSLYGASKLFGEALCRLYVDRYDMQIACLRIGSCFDQPRNPRMLGTWLSPADAVRLVQACLTSSDLRYAVVYGTSANTRHWWDLTPAMALGYRPEDNAEEYAERILEPFGGADPQDPLDDLQGGAAAWRPNSGQP